MASTSARNAPRAMGSFFRENGFSNIAAEYLSEEWVPELQGERALAIYREMSRNEPVIGAIFYLIESIMRGREWKYEAADDSNQAGAAREFTEQCIADMDHPFDHVVVDAQSQYPFGYSWHEIVWKVRNGDSSNPTRRSRYSDGKYGWRKIVGRSQTCLREFVRDPDGGDWIGAKFNFPGRDAEVFFARYAKSLHFRSSPLFDDPYGVSVLRTAYRPWWFKKRYEALEHIGTERDLAGYLLVQPPEGMEIWDDNDPEAVGLRVHVERFIASARVNDLGGGYLPFGWKAELLRAPGDKQTDASRIITRLEHRMATSTVADFVMLGQQDTGSNALARTKAGIFLDTISQRCRNFAEEWRNQALKPLMRLNGMPEELAPHLRFSRIQGEDLGAFSAFINALGNFSKSPLMQDEAVRSAILAKGGLPRVADTSILEGAHDKDDDPAEKDEAA